MRQTCSLQFSYHLGNLVSQSRPEAIYISRRGNQNRSIVSMSIDAKVPAGTDVVVVVVRPISNLPVRAVVYRLKFPGI